MMTAASQLVNSKQIWKNMKKHIEPADSTEDIDTDEEEETEEEIPVLEPTDEF